MANNEIKTNAEIYREQRKERLAKAQKKKNGKGDKIIRILVKTLCIILVVGVVLYGAANILTKVFCLPQKVLTVATYEGEKINVAEYNYYYMYLYQQIASTTQQIDSYYGAGYGAYYTGFDLTKDPAEQEYVGEDAPEGVETWADYFRAMTPVKAFMQKEFYKDATSEETKKAGFELTAEQKEEMTTAIDERIETLTKDAEEADFALNNYIGKVCGEGLTEKSYRELLERDSVVQYYLEWYESNTSENISDADVKKYYEDNKADFDYADLRLFEISYAEPEKDSKDPSYTKKQAKERAEEFAGKITDEKSFVSLAEEYALPSQKENYSKDSATLAENYQKASIEASVKNVAEWAFDDARKTGEVKVIHEEDAEAYYIVYIVSPAARDTQTAGADVRHILVQAETTKEDSEGNSVDLSQDEIDKNFAEAKKEAEKILKEWKDGKATEDTFAALAKEKTDDTGSKETGGLYEDITSTSSYVPEFLDWSLASHKVGDTGIIKTDYGYHIMYFVGADKTQKWESDVRSAITAEKFENYSSELLDTVSDKVERTDFIINYFVKTNEKLISQNVAANAASASNSSTITY